MTKVLLIANKTLASGEVSNYVRDKITKGSCEFTLLVPATPRHGDEPTSKILSGIANAKEPGGLAPPTADNYEHARSRLQFGLDTLRSLGATIDGDVGDPDPAKAIDEMLKRRHFDEVALSTLPTGISRWLHLDIPHRVQRRHHIPVTVIRVQTAPVDQ